MIVQLSSRMLSVADHYKAAKLVHVAPQYPHDFTASHCTSNGEVHNVLHRRIEHLQNRVQLCRGWPALPALGTAHQSLIGQQGTRTADNIGECNVHPRRSVAQDGAKFANLHPHRQWIEYKAGRGLRGRRTNFIPMWGSEMGDIEELVKETRQEALIEQASGLDADLRLGVSAKKGDARKGMWRLPLRCDTVLALCDEIDRLRVERDDANLHIKQLETGFKKVEAERDALKDVLLRHGFVECDIAACNYGSWHARYGLRERMGEMRHMLEDAGHPLSNANDNLISNALKELIAERDALQEEIVGWKADQKENLTNQCDLVAECNALRAFAQGAYEQSDPPDALWDLLHFHGLLRFDDDANTHIPTPLLTGEQQT